MRKKIVIVSLLFAALIGCGGGEIELTELALQKVEGELTAVSPEEAVTRVEEAENFVRFYTRPENVGRVSEDQLERARSLLRQRRREQVALRAEGIGESASEAASEGASVVKDVLSDLTGIDPADLNPAKVGRWFLGVDTPRFQEFLRCRDATTEAERVGCP